ncbi:hypothetical protein SNEBB_006513, partial [Seison nebaliae]
MTTVSACGLSLKALKKKRASVRCSVTKRLTSLQDALKQRKVESINRYVELAEESIRKATEFDERIASLMAEEEMDEDFAVSEDLQLRWEDELHQAKEVLRKCIRESVENNPDHTNVPASDISSKSKIIGSDDDQRTPLHPPLVSSKTEQRRLPRLELPKFAGDVAKWPEFWENFANCVHRSSEYSDEIKHGYFRQCLEGVAADDLAGLPATADNYPIAIDTIKSHFGRKRTVVEALINDMRNIKPISRNEPIRPFAQRIRRNVRNLRSSGILDEHYEVWGLQKLLECSNDDIRKKWHERHWNQDDPKLIDFLNILDEVVREEEAYNKPEYRSANTYSTLVQSAVPNTGPQVRPISLKRETYCFFCNNPNHLASDCPTELSERWDMAKRKNLCFNCLRPGHATNACKSKYRCRKCNKRHNTALCNESTSHNQTVLTASNKREIAHTVTAWSATGNEQTVLLDTGSDKSYVTKDALVDLQCRTIGSTSLCISTFGGHSETYENVDVVQFRLFDKHRNKSLEVKASVVPFIAKVNKVICHKTKRQEDMDDILIVENAPVSILLGSDLYWSIMTGNCSTIDTTTSLRKIETIFGTAFCGSTNQSRDTALSLVTTSQMYKVCNEVRTEDEEVKAREDGQAFKEKIEMTKSNDRMMVSLPFRDDRRPDQNAREVRGRMEGMWCKMETSAKAEIEQQLNVMAEERRLEFESLVLEIEDTMNKRPLLSEVSDDTTVIRPIDFLQPTRSKFIVDGGSDLMGEMRFQKEEYTRLAEQFRRTYIDKLRDYHRNRTKQPSKICVGDVVLVADDNERKGWPIGRITKTFEGPDGMIRRVSLQLGKDEKKKEVV